MSFLNTIGLMQNELLLLLLLLLIIVAEIFSGDNKRSINLLSIFGILIITILGFVSTSHGSIFGGMFVSNSLTALMKSILNIGTLVVVLQSIDWLSKDENTVRTSEYHSLLYSTLIGMNFLISSGDFLMFFIGIELATLPLAALASFEVRKSRSAEAGIKMILSSAFASAISLMGVSLIYAISGSIYFSEITITDVYSPIYILAFVFFFSGLAFKLSIVPFHFWTADVYEGAPVNITSYFSVISKGSALFILLILFFKVFQTSEHLWKMMVYGLAILTMTVGNLFAIRQTNIKRFLAFSSIAQAGFLFLGVYSGTAAGMNASIYFMLIYIFSNLGAFGVVAAISYQSGKENIQDYNGLYRTNPKLSLLMLLSLFSLAGIPPVAGFFGKFFLFMSAASQGSYVLVLIATLNATLSLYYYLLVVKAMFINKNEDAIPHFISGTWTRLAMVICLLAILSIGFISGLHEHIQLIAENFLL
jgi:NADH-quinone oxidoreductase subunit N